MKVKKLHPEAIIPKYATQGAACFDLHTIGAADVIDSEINRFTLEGGKQRIFRTGLAFEIPEGWRMDVFSRSGHGFKFGIRLANGTGKIDSDFRGELMVCLRNDSDRPVSFEKGERIAQGELNQVHQVIFESVDELSETERGTGGFGSTGK